jgi:hypothetical protein
MAVSPFSARALDRGDWDFSRTGRFTLGERTLRATGEQDWPLQRGKVVPVLN